MTGIFKINNNEVFGSDGTFSGTIGSNATFPLLGYWATFGVLDANFVNGSSYATAFSVVVSSKALVADGTTQLSILYKLQADNGGTNAMWQYQMSGGITVGTTNIIAANANANTNVINVDIPANASDITINIGTSRDSGGNNTAYKGSYIFVTENPR